MSPSLSNCLSSDYTSWRPKVSYFEAPIHNVKPSEDISLLEVYRRITGERYAGITGALRNLQEPKEKRRYKAKHFPYVTFAGIFSKRQDAALLTPSQLMVFDFDHLHDLQLARQQLLELYYFDTELLFTSPSGNGLKWIIRFDRDDISYEDYFLSVTNYLFVNNLPPPDISGKDLSRACFLCQDPEAYLNHKHFF